MKKVIDNTNVEEKSFVRTDITMHKMLLEKPYSRFDPNYWDPIMDSLFDNVKYPINEFGEFLKKDSLIVTDNYIKIAKLKNV